MRTLIEVNVNMPNFTRHIPGQGLHEHSLRSCVPAPPQSFVAEWQDKTEECDRHAAVHAVDVTVQFDAHARPLPKLSVGQQVRNQDPISHHWDMTGFVLGIGRSRDYQGCFPSVHIL